MKLKQIRWGLILVCGWLVILVSAAILMPPTNSKIVSVMAIPILALMLFWLLLSVVGIFVYFYRVWRRIAFVANKAAYIAWMSIETTVALAGLGGIVWLFLTPS
jgi:fatty-acid desaturase